VKTRVDRTRTKIVCTIGPASRDEATLRAMIRTGMDVARINFSHGTHDEHAFDIAVIRRLAQDEGAAVAVMADLQGPKFRLGTIEPEPLVLRRGDRVVLTSRKTPKERDEIHLPHPEVIDGVSVGSTLLLDDGTLEFTVKEKESDRLVCQVVVGGELRSHVGITSPEELPLVSSITPKDRDDAAFALEQGVDFLALSFVRDASTIQELRRLIQQLTNSKRDVGIVAKIEKQEALDNFDAILDATDAVMVARGDLGVEISVQEVPLHQKAIIRKCNQAGKPVITATQMLQSMIDHPRPTRAEASDVANAILDGTDAVMLSGETAVGRYPVRAVETIVEISTTVEKEALRTRDEVGFAAIKHQHPITDAISDATATVAREVGARLIVTSTWSGYTARQVARERPRVPIVALTPNETVWRRLALTWGVIPVLVEPIENTDKMLQMMQRTVLELGLATQGDLVVVTGGLPLGGGKTNFLKVHRLKQLRE